MKNTGDNFGMNKGSIEGNQQKGKDGQNNESLQDKVSSMYEEGKETVKETVNELYNQTKDTVSGLYQEGMHKACEAKESIQEHADQLVTTIKEKPLMAVLVAAAVGFALSALSRK